MSTLGTISPRVGSPGPTTTVKLRIESVYRDDDTKFQDMAVSDIAFYAIS